MDQNVIVLGQDTFTNLSETAKAIPRLRKNYNVHADLNDPVQRLYNALEPNTYVRPHRHQGEDRWEFFQIVFGSAVILTFNERGTVLEKIKLSSKGPNYAVEIPGNSWHTVVSLEIGTVLFEVKQGPYQAGTDKDFAPWTPLEGEPAANALVRWFVEASPGDAWLQQQ